MIALALAGTSYLMVFRPSIELFEEIIDKENTVFSGLTGFLIWTIIATLIAPYVVFVLLQNNNKDFIENFAIGLLTKEDDDE
jgi:K+ transporter